MVIQGSEKCMVILGAGASADFPVPTSATMFHDTQVREYLQSESWLLENLHRVFWEPRGHTLETSHESLNIEQMLTILRNAKFDNSVPDILDETDLARFQR